MNRMLKCCMMALQLLLFTTTVYTQTWQRTAPDSSRLTRTYQTKTSNFSSKSSYGKISENISRTSNTGDSALTLFGFDLFSREISEGSSGAEAFTLPKKYLLGPGDRVGIYLLGTVQENIDVVVNVEGKIFLPPAGVLNVWGLSMIEFKKLLKQKLSQYYENFTLDIMLLQPKNVLVAVVGDVIHPGKYVLSSLNTVLDAIIMAGGPSEKGSIRGIQLLRQGKLIASADLYEFLMEGKTGDDMFLQAGDKIRVPYAQKTVSISGEVNRASIFELKPDAKETISDLIHLAGGFTDLAYIQKLEISRLENNGQRKLRYIDFNRIQQGDSTENVVLMNNDRITIYSKLEQLDKREVAIFGEIRKPGIYPLEDNMHLSDLILKAGNLNRRAYTLEAEIAKIDPGEPTNFLKVNLDKLGSGTNGDTDIILEEDDQVFIRRIPRWKVGLTVHIQGEVLFPGRYSIVKDSTHLSAILMKAGGFTDDGFLQESYLMRPSSRIIFDKEFERLKEMRREEMSDLEYQYFVMRQNSENVERIVVDFEKLMQQGDKSQDVILEDGDIIVIPKAPIAVTVTGSVAKPGGVTYVAGQKLSYYLKKAGGASWDAKLSNTKIIKVTGEVVDDEDVKSFSPGDIIWVPRKEDKSFWPTFLQTVSVAAQLASIYLIIDTSINRN